MSTALTLLTSGHGLLEGARWYDGALVFSDMVGNGGVHRLRPGQAPEVLIPHRKGIGGLVAHVDGGFVVSGRNVSRKCAGQDGADVYLEPAEDEQFFNDLTAGTDGSVYVGSVAKQSQSGAEPMLPGRLYRIDTGGAVTTLATDVLTSNGLGTDASGRFLYHVDSYRHTVWRFDLSTPEPQRIAFADTTRWKGVPDGLAVATDGSVWVAQAGGGVVIAWDAAGSLIAEIAVPQQLVTSVGFGGDDLHDLYVLTGVERGHHDPVGGAVYLRRSAIAGQPSPVATVRARPSS